MTDFGEFYVSFKKVTHAPVIEKSFDFCSDASFLCDNNVFQHVEISFLEKDGYTAYVARTSKGITPIYHRDYTFIDNEGYWVCYVIKVPKHEIALIKEFCKSCVEETAYDFSSLYFAWFQKLAFMLKRSNTHSCTSLTFNALLQSPSFKQLLLNHIFNNNTFDMLKQSHSPDPNNIYRIFKTLIQKAEDGDFGGSYPVSKLKMKYVYDFTQMNNYARVCIRSSDDYFITSPEQEEDCE